MRWMAGALLAVLAGCGGTGDSPGDGAGDADTDTDADTDSDTDSDTDTRPERIPLTCPESGCDADPVGNWTVLGECIADPALDEVRTRCDGVVVTLYPAGTDGTLLFSGTNYSFNVNNGGQTQVEILVPEACNSTGCLNWEIPNLNVKCATDGAGGCDCTGNSPTSVWLDAGTWTRAGSTLSLHSDSTGGDKTAEVCATADTLYLYDPIRGVSLSAVPSP